MNKIEKKPQINKLYFIFFLLLNIQSAFSQNIYTISVKYDNEILIDSGKIIHSEIKIKSDILMINNGLIINKDTISVDSNIYVSYKEFSFNFNPKDVYLDCNNLKVVIYIPKIIYKNIFTRIWTNIFYKKNIFYIVDFNCEQYTLSKCFQKRNNKRISCSGAK